MISDLKEIHFNLETSEVFKKWKSNHKSAFLSSCFIVDPQGWQLAYYSPDNKRISTFSKGRLIQSDSPIFKYQEREVEQLNLDEVKIDDEKAFEIADQILKEKHPETKSNKKIIILQKISNIIWNVTYTTTNFHIFNIKINAITGEVTSDDYTSAMYSNIKKNPNLR